MHIIYAQISYTCSANTMCTLQKEIFKLYKYMHLYNICMYAGIISRHQLCTYLIPMTVADCHCIHRKTFERKFKKKEERKKISFLLNNKIY